VNPELNDVADRKQMKIATKANSKLNRRSERKLFIGDTLAL
jgi:hypothetical protein